jgi:hypothetical protein
VAGLKAWGGAVEPLRPGGPTPLEIVDFGGLNKFLTRSVCLKARWPDYLGCVFGVWPAPEAREGSQKCGGRSPPHFGRVSRAPGARHPEGFNKILNRVFVGFDTVLKPD